MGNLFNARRDGARLLQLLIFNEESLVCAVHQTAQNASLPFVHTARRTYRLDDPARCLESRVLGFRARGMWRSSSNLIV